MNIARFRRFTLVLLLGGMAIVHGFAQRSFVPSNGFVPDQQTAIRIAEAILDPIYGEGQVASERPFGAELRSGVWIVTGHLATGNGGVAEVRISKATGRIISVSHGK
jgi:hypothetical protein